MYFLPLLKCWGVQLGLLSLVVGSANAFGSIHTLAQVATDNTLGSVVIDTGNGIDTITGGVTQNTNLFHSFDSFSVPNGRTAFFNNATNIQNILTRVTGGSISNIDGLIRANGAANLFLLNPNGIIFGRNARLNIGGSFIGTTANNINFADGTQFSAIPGTGAPLLTVSVPIGLQYGSSAGNIINRASDVGLQVAPGKTLGLVGGNVNLEGGNLTAAGGRIALSAVAAPGVVGLNSDDSGFRFSFPTELALGDISLTSAAVNVRSGGGGSIAIDARNLNLVETSLQAGINSGLGSIGSQAGDIEINATGAIDISSNSAIGNEVQRTAVGNAGNINIKTGSLSLTRQAKLNAGTFGQGNAGNVTINARDTILFDNDSGIITRAESNAVGNAGEIEIATGSFAATNGGVLVASTRGRGRAGNITINARDRVSFDGSHPNTPSGAFSVARVNAQGNAGNIKIAANSVSIANGARLDASTLARQGRGDAGNIEITTGSLSVMNDVELETSTDGQGNAGSIIINVRDRALFDGMNTTTGAFSRVENDGVGQGGNIEITAGSLSLINGAVLSTTTSGTGNAGSVIINARDRVSIDGGSYYQAPGGIFSRTERNATGNAGNIEIKTGLLSIKNGASLSTRTITQGDGGNITINASSLEAIDGGQIITTTYGSGKAGNITLDVNDSISLSGIDRNYSARLGNDELVRGIGSSSGIFANTTEDSTGQGGSLRINARESIVRNGAKVSVSSQGRGSAGDLTLISDNVQLDRGFLEATTTTGDRGNINLRSRFIEMRRGSKISTNASGDASGGNININTEFLVAVPDEDNDIIANAVRGTAGNIDITAQSIFGIQPRRQETSATNDITANSELGIDGTVRLNSPEVDPSRDLVELPTIPVDASSLVGAGCSSGAESRFAVTGRGGLPPTPRERLNADAILTDWATLPAPETENRAAVETDISVATNTTATPLVEATSWQFDRDGAIILTSSNVTSNNHFEATPTSCPSL